MCAVLNRHQGIGRSCALLFAKENAKVVVSEYVSRFARAEFYMLSSAASAWMSLRRKLLLTRSKLLAAMLSRSAAMWARTTSLTAY